MCSGSATVTTRQRICYPILCPRESVRNQRPQSHPRAPGNSLLGEPEAAAGALSRADSTRPRGPLPTARFCLSSLAGCRPHAPVLGRVSDTRGTGCDHPARLPKVTVTCHPSQSWWVKGQSLPKCVGLQEVEPQRVSFQSSGKENHHTSSQSRNTVRGAARPAIFFQRPKVSETVGALSSAEASDGGFAGLFY